ncbi:MAG: hypothetical protein MUC48_20670 [Leptolyngbya sp. Prado105]|jgi:hypothetical protein|nr:hypothetical protein [Leptolyngbya sp. Prado105]
MSRIDGQTYKTDFMKLFSSIRHSLVGLFVGIGTVIYSHSALAADAIVFRYI